MKKLLNEIKEYLQEHKEIKAVSFDIFDTVLLRQVEESDDVYLEAGKCLELPEGFTPEEYQYVRRRTQQNVQRKKEETSGSAEVSLREIVAEIPKWIGEEAEFFRAELTAEKRLCFCNLEIYQFVKWLKSECYHVFYVSDMYFSAEDITDILRNAGAFSCRVHVSSEYGVNKRSGELFEQVLRVEGYDPSQVIHIGDNWEADVLGAEKCGIKSFYYDSIHKDVTQGLLMEQHVYGRKWNHKNSLRQVAAGCYSGDNEEEEQWFALGAEMLGPLLAYFTEWLFLQIADKEKEKIVFLMREGSFFQKAWSIYSEYENVVIENELLYVSRQALLLASMAGFGEDELKTILEMPKITLAEVFELLQIERELERFLPHMATQAKDFEKVYLEGKTLYEKLRNFLLLEENVHKIEKLMQEKRRLAKSYLKQVCTSQQMITVDIGYQGTIQKRLEKLLTAEDGYSWRHCLLLCNGEKRLEDLACSNIQGALGTYLGEGSDLMSVVNRNNRSLELLFLEGCGSTIDYEMSGNLIRPVLGSLDWPQMQARCIEACQEGALNYLELYCQCRNKPKWTSKELLQMLHRLLSHPSYNEAKMLGNLVFDENSGTRYSRKVCDESEVVMAENNPEEVWQLKCNGEDVHWIEGVLSLGSKSYILRNSYQAGGSIELYALELVNRAITENIEKMYIVAAGAVGKWVLRYAKLVGIEVIAFIDNNPAMYKKKINDISVISLENSKECYPYVIASILYNDELRQQVVKEKGNNCRILY